MGTGAWSTGWGWDYQEAEIDFRRAGGNLGGMMGVAHYAAMLYPARALGDRELWPKLKALMLEWMESGENETSLVPQWDASLRYDQRAALPSVRVPVHVLAFAEDVQAPPQDGEEVARLVPGAKLVGLNVDHTWDNAAATGGNLDAYQPATVRGGHAVTLVGYRADGRFIIRNSWGTAWGDHGFAYASEAYINAAFYTESYGVTL